MKPQRSGQIAWLVAIAGPPLVTAIRLAIGPVMVSHLPMALYLTPVVAAAWLGGIAPGCVATLIGGVLGWYYFLLPENSPAAAQFFVMLIYGVMGLFVSTACEMLRRTIDRATRSAGDALENQRKLQQEAAQRQQAQEALQMHSKVLEFMAEGVLLVDDAGIIQYVNPAANALFGYEGNELIGQQAASLNAYPPDENQRIVAEVMAELRAKGQWSGEWLNRRQDGTVFTSFGRISALDLRGQRYWVNVQQDISDRKRAQDSLREREAWLSSVFESAVDFAIITTDLEGKITSWNSGATRILGYHADEVVGGNLSVIFTASDREQGRPSFELDRALREGRVENERWHLRKNGTRFWASGLTTSLKTERDEARGFLLILRDMTVQRRAIEAVEEATRRTSTILESITDAFYALDHNWHFTYLNRQCEAYFGMPRENLLGRVIWDVFPDARGAGLEDRYQRAMTEREAVHFEAQSIITDRWMEIHAYPSADGLSVYFRDVTERRQAEVENKQLLTELVRQSRDLQILSQATQDVNAVLDTPAILRTLVDSAAMMTYADSGTAGVYVNDTMVFKEYNQRGKVIPIDLVFRRDDRYGIPSWIIRHQQPYLTNDGDNDPFLRPDLREQFGVRNVVNLPIFGGDGELLGCFELHNKQGGSPFTQDDILKLQGLSASAAIALQNAQLLEQIRQADRRKDDFLAMLAHELRNPLAPVRNAIEILRMRPNDAETVEQMQSMMERQIHHMARLVDDLLDVSRITRGKIELRQQRLDLGPVLIASVDDHRASAASSQVTLRYEAPEQPVNVFGDQTRLAQVVDNLLTNAVKFSEPGGEIVVTLSSDAELHQAVFSVRDSGIGIDAETLPRVFDVFAQADRSLDRSRGGLGLGLALVKGLVEMHKGSVVARSEGLGKGAEFTIRLPLTEEPTALESMPLDTPAVRRPLHVLVIEDNRDSANSLKMFLELSGYQTSVAYNGHEGVAVAVRERPNAVICDIGLPGMDGYAVAKSLRENPRTAQTRLIALTGYGQEDDKRRALAAGFDDHLIKPANPAKVLAKLDVE